VFVCVCVCISAYIPISYIFIYTCVKASYISSSLSPSGRVDWNSNFLHASYTPLARLLLLHTSYTPLTRFLGRVDWNSNDTCLLSRHASRSLFGATVQASYARAHCRMPRCVCVCVCVNINIHTRIHTHTHTLTHKHCL
jgi:hypothetical protein